GLHIMAQDGGSGRQNQDRNGSSASNLLLWGGLIVATGLLLVLWVPSYFFTRELDPKDFKKLVEASPREEKGGSFKEGYNGTLDVRDKDKQYRFSNLKTVVINDRSFTGSVDVVELVPQGTKGKLEPNGEKSWKQ